MFSNANGEMFLRRGIDPLPVETSWHNCRAGVGISRSPHLTRVILPTPSDFYRSQAQVKISI